jgi:hypothetical protein
MDSNPFADLIEQYKTKPQEPQANPFSDLIAQYKKPDWRDVEVQSNLTAMQPQDPGTMEVRGNILPLSRNVETGKRSLAVPGAIYDPATLPGDVYTGKVDPQSDEGGRRALGFAAATLPSNIARGARMRPGTPEPQGVVAADAKLVKPTPREAEAELIGSGGGKMNKAKLMEGSVAHEDLRASMSGLNEGMREATLRPDAKLHPAASDLYGRMLDLVRAPKGDPLSGMTKNAPPAMKTASMQELHELRQIADDVIAKGWNPQLRQATSEGKLGMMMKNTIDEMIAKHPAAQDLMAGKSEYARGMKSKTISGLVDRASKTTMWDRGDHAGAIRNTINTFLKSKDSRFLTQAEVKELRKIKRYGFSDALAGQGSLSPMALTIGRIVEGITGLPQGSLFVAGRMVREGVNARRPAELERMAARIRAGK